MQTPETDTFTLHEPSREHFCVTLPAISAQALPQPESRYHSLDALRATAMLLGILLHAAISFTQPSPPHWPVFDCSRQIWAGALVLSMHAFRMETFFIMAGFFGYMLLMRRGPMGFVTHRLKRVVLPFVVSSVVLLPLLHVIFDYGYRQRGVLPSEMPANAHWFHLWFLLYLIVLYVVFLATLPVTEAILARGWPDRVMGWILRSRFKPLLMAAVTVPLLYPMRDWTVDLTETYWPEWHLVLYYAMFFGFGWLLYRQRQLLDECTRCWRSYLVLGIFLVLPVMLFLVTKSPRAGGNVNVAYHWPMLGAYALFTWMMVFGLLGMFVKCFSYPSPLMRYISDSSYWLYLAHLPLIVCLQYAVSELGWRTLPKLSLIMVVSVAILLWSYDRFIRYTFVGAMLNGRKVRPVAGLEMARVANEA